MTVRPGRPLGAARATIVRHQTPAYFVLTFVVSWGIWGSRALGVTGGPTVVYVLAGTFGPAVAAAAVTWLAGGSLRAWARGLLRWRVPLRWYAAAVGLPLASLAVFTAVLVVGWGYPLQFGRTLRALPAFLPATLAIVLVAGGNEELGWRGFALPRLSRSRGPFRASLLVGVVWGVWHLPLAAFPGTPQLRAAQSPHVALGYAVGVVGLSVLFAWLYNGAGSVLPVMVAHGLWNNQLALAPLPPVGFAGGIPLALALGFPALLWLAVVGLVAVVGPDLGWRPDERRSAVDAGVARSTDPNPR